MVLGSGVSLPKTVLIVYKLMSKLKAAQINWCQMRRPVLLYADDRVMFKEDDEMMRRALEKLDEWCTEWAV